MSLCDRSNLSGSRREFLRQLGWLGSAVPASILLRGLRDAATLQRSSASPASRKPASSADHVTGFHFTDVAAQAGLGRAINVFGGGSPKRWLLGETGGGVGRFRLVNDGWLAI